MNAANGKRDRSSISSIPESLHPEQRVKLGVVEALTGRGRTSLYGEMKASIDPFPQPERDGRRCSRWRVGDVLDWLQRRREHPPTSALDIRTHRATTPEKSRAAAAALGAKLVGDLTDGERAAWEAAGRPGYVKFGRGEFVRLDALQRSLGQEVTDAPAPRRARTRTTSSTATAGA